MLRRLLRPAILLGRRRAVRDVLRRALANGYDLGEHCLAAACAITRTMPDRMAAHGHLDAAPTWARTRCPDDVMLGILTGAVGLRHVNLTERHDPFGLKYVGPPDAPAALLVRGIGLVHSVKNDARWGEAEVRQYFRARRAVARESDAAS